MTQASASTKLSQKELEILVIESDSGARHPSSPIAAGLIYCTAISWALFQVWIASPLPFMLNFGILDSTETRSIHLGFCLFLAFLAYPAFKNSPRMSIGIFDWCFALLGAFCATYIFFFYEELALRAGRPTEFDVYVGCAGVLLLFEATRRALGLPLVCIGSTLLLYSHFGSHDLVPDIIRHGGHSLSKMASHFWLTTEGVFGIALGVSTKFVFLFVLFGSMLDKAGAGAYFIRIAFSLVGHFRGGPAKAAVLASGLTGMVSGSSIANVVTTGTFTIPLMRKVGFSGRKAGAIEVAASVNGQIMPPVMGAAAFLMIDYVGIPYFDIVKHAFLPAVISYIALLYMVHLEAVKNDMRVIPKSHTHGIFTSMMYYGISIASIVIVSMISYWAVSWVRPLLGEYASIWFGVILVTVYMCLLRISCQVKEVSAADEKDEMLELPPFRETFISGLHYLLPIIVLVWFLMVERKSPGLSVFYAIMLMVFIILTQDVLRNLFRGKGDTVQCFKKGVRVLEDAFLTGSRNMIGIAAATAAAGIVVGAVSLTGVGQVLAEVVEVVAGDSFFLILLLTAFICLILGMGLPTTANYIVVAALMAGVVQELAAKNGIIIPLIAIHLFVFYFGIMADVTPPVGLASFASAAISGADPIKTGLYAFMYSLRTAILPFFFVFNHEMLLIGVDTVLHAMWVFFYCTAAILIFSAATQGYFLVRSKWYESVMLLVSSFIIFAPSLLNNVVYPPEREFSLLNAQSMSAPVEYRDGRIKISGVGEDLYGEPMTFNLYSKIEEGDSVESLIKATGIGYEYDGRNLRVLRVKFGSVAEQNEIDPLGNFMISAVSLPQPQPDKRLMYIPAVILFGFVLLSQILRRRKERVIEKFSKWVN